MTHQVTLINYNAHVLNFIGELQRDVMFLCKVISRIDELTKQIENNTEISCLLNSVRFSIITYLNDKNIEKLEHDIGSTVCQIILLVEQKPIMNDLVFEEFCELLT